MNQKIERIAEILSWYCFSYSSEIQLQDQIESVFKKNGINYRREFRLSKSDIVDFFIDGIAVEIKVKGRAMPIFRQLERYTKHDNVSEILLISTKRYPLPPQISGKNAYSLYVGAL